MNEVCDCSLCQQERTQAEMAAQVEAAAKAMENNAQQVVAQTADPYYISVEEVEQYVDGTVMFQLDVGPGMANVLLKEGLLSLLVRRANETIEGRSISQEETPK